MKTSDFDYDLPGDLIAQEPARERDASRLLALDKKNGRIEQGHFFDILDYLQAGDVLVLNNSKVFPARLRGKKKHSGGQREVFLLKRHSLDSSAQREIWQCLIGGRGARPGLVIDFAQGLEAEIVKDNGDGTWLASFNRSGSEMMAIVQAIGQTPLPPYIKRSESRKEDTSAYQTVYADDKRVGSVAAPTAGLHFSEKLLKKIKHKGVQIVYITLHVGLGTFASVKSDKISEHKMHSEYIEISAPSRKALRQAKQNGQRIVAVGTTSVRTLEAMAGEILSAEPSGKKISAWVDIFIYPGYRFRMVDAMITNFHLPKSTLLMLVSALAGTKSVKRAYSEAIKQKYRFYSYGDAMFIF